MDINLAFRPEGATHAGKEDGHGSWFKQDDAGRWQFIDMADDGLPDREWDSVPDNEPGYELYELPAELFAAPKPTATGGPAFPCHTNPRPGQLADAPQGMTLRDYFATKAMQGICAHNETWGQQIDEIAVTAYKLADAMLAARGGS